MNTQSVQKGIRFQRTAEEGGLSFKWPTNKFCFSNQITRNSKNQSQPLVSLVVLGLVVARDTPFHMGMLFQTSEHQTTIEPFVDNRIHQKGHSRLLLLHDKFGNGSLNDGPSPFVSATVSHTRSHYPLSCNDVVQQGSCIQYGLVLLPSLDCTKYVPDQYIYIYQYHLIW